MAKKIEGSPPYAPGTHVSTKDIYKKNITYTWSDGTIYDPAGIDDEKLAIKGLQLRLEPVRGRRHEKPPRGLEHVQALLLVGVEGHPGPADDPEASGPCFLGDFAQSAL